MSDRTWNHIDARLYEEDWSEEAIIIAACMIARCPNQYGVFDTPMGFLAKFFKKMFAREQIELVLTELEAAGFLKFYNDKNIVWIVAKWKRAHKPSANHWKGAITHLNTGYQSVIGDFTTYYHSYWDSIGIPLGGSGEGVPNTMPKSDSESDTDSDIKDKIKLHCPAKTAGRAKKPKKNKPRVKKTPARLWLEFYKIEFKDRKGTEPVLSQGDCINAQKRYTATAKIHQDNIIKGVTKYYLNLKDEVWAGHKPHVLFKNFDRLLEGMMEHQAKRERGRAGLGLSPQQSEFEKTMADIENNPQDYPDEVPDKYKLPEATPDG